MDRRVGHVALYLGNAQIIQCSGGKQGSNAGKSTTSNGRVTGWVRWAKVSG